MTETFEIVHFPACNSRCDGDSHWLDGGPKPKAFDRLIKRADWQAKNGRKARIAHRRKRLGQ